MAEHQETVSLGVRFTRAVAWTGAAKWALQLVSWPLTLVTARVLSPRDYGYIGTVALFTRLAQLIVEGGLGAAIVNGPRLTDRQLGQLNSLVIGTGCVAFLVVSLSALPAAAFFRDDALKGVMLALGCAIAVEAFGVIPLSTLKRSARFKELAVIDLSRGLIDLTVTLILALSGARYWSLIVGYSSGLLVSVLLLRRLAPVPFLRFKGTDVRQTLSTSRHLVGQAVLQHFSSSIDSGIVSRIASPAGLGLYSFGRTLAVLPAERITDIVLRVVPSMFGAIREDRSRVTSVYLDLTALVTAVSVPMFVGLGLVGQDVVRVILGDRWSGLSVVLYPFIAYGLVTELTVIVPHLLQAIGRAELLSRNAFVSFLVLPPTFLLFGFNWGLAGVAWGWALGACLNSALLLTELRQYGGVGFRRLLACTSAPLVASILMAATVFLLKVSVWIQQFSDVQRLVMLITLGVFVYTPVCYMMGRERFDRVLSHVSRR